MQKPKRYDHCKEKIKLCFIEKYTVSKEVMELLFINPTDLITQMFF